MAREATGEAFASVWCSRTGARSRNGMPQRIYELREVADVTCPPGRFKQATADHLELVRRWGRGFHDDCFGDEYRERSAKAAEGRLQRGDLFLWVDDMPRSMAARVGSTAHGRAVSLVYTPPENRRKGYATAVVARLSQQLLDDGNRFCTLYTDLGNPISNSIYTRIGYRPVADVVDVLFEGGPGGKSPCGPCRSSTGERHGR